MRLVITRPREDAERQADQLRALGHEPLIHPLLEILYLPLPTLDFDDVQALIITSRNALRALSQNDGFNDAKKLPVYCVGEGTAEFARDLGFSTIFVGGGTARELIPTLTDTVDPNGGILLYLTGQNLAYDLEAPLTDAGFQVKRIIAYKALPLGREHIVNFAKSLKRGVDGVLLMSPRTASAFINFIKIFGLEQETRAIICYCYAETIARPLGEIDGLTIAVSSSPTEDEFLKLIGEASSQGNLMANLRQTLGNH